MNNDLFFDVVIIGGGHAGCEAAAASARMGVNTGLFTHRLDTIGEMSCNPAIGGLGKGHLVKEIDALDGVMGIVADKSGIQFRLLNRSRGPAVRGHRTQSDRALYKKYMQEILLSYCNLMVFSDPLIEFIFNKNKVVGFLTKSGKKINCKKMILTTGTFLNGLIHIGDERTPAGRHNEKPSTGLSEQLMKFKMKLGRLKTGTPPRLDGSTINYANLEKQDADTDPEYFSFLTMKTYNKQIACSVTYTNKKVHELIKKNLKRSAMYSGSIKGVGPRYCPSIEDKVVKFSDQYSSFYIEDDNSNNLAFDASFIDCYLNGVRLVNGVDCTVSSGNSIVLASGAQLNDTLEAVAFGVFNLASIAATDLTDVSTGGVQDGQVLVYSSSNSRFQPGNASSAEVYGFNLSFVASTINYTVDVQSHGGSNKYFILGYPQRTLELEEGNTYVFTYPSGHPFALSTTSNGTHGGGSEYTTGVTRNSGANTLTYVVPTGAPTLYYYCTSHSGMGGQANTPAPLDNNLQLTTTNQGQDNISNAQYAAFDDVLFSASGFSFSLSNGSLIATI